MGESLGTQIELDVTNIAHGGVSVARHDGRVVFVADAVPGERVLARVCDDRKGSFWRADTVRVLRASEHRREHVWASASIDRDPSNRVGGAEFGHISLDYQRALKGTVLSESLQRMAGITREVIVEPAPGDNAVGGRGWRTRVRLHVDDEGRLGQYAARSHRVIPVSDLPLATDALAASAPLGERFTGEVHVDVLAPSVGGARLIVGEQRASTITERVGRRDFRLAESGFWQVHHGAAATLTAAVQGAIDPDLFDPDAANLDLYGGVGLLAAAVGDRFGNSTRVTSVESDSTATRFASENLADFANARAETARVENWVRAAATAATEHDRARFAASTVVLDPPRAGAGRAVVDGIAALSPTQVVYVACDPVAFARDVELFARHGYRLQGLRAFDLFPHTHHVEAVGSLSK
jgi:tRNA/tmRNA/rRNA uracil-C5-methylase (TrmA/RlmC/RlmD family)